MFNYLTKTNVYVILKASCVAAFLSSMQSRIQSILINMINVHKTRHYKNPIQRVGLEQCGYHHDIAEKLH
jgi:hypothetical protein